MFSDARTNGYADVTFDLILSDLGERISQNAKKNPEQIELDVETQTNMDEVETN